MQIHGRNSWIKGTSANWTGNGATSWGRNGTTWDLTYTSGEFSSEYLREDTSTADKQKAVTIKAVHKWLDMLSVVMSSVQLALIYRNIVSSTQFIDSSARIIIVSSVTLPSLFQHISNNLFVILYVKFSNTDVNSCSWLCKLRVLTNKATLLGSQGTPASCAVHLNNIFTDDHFKKINK